MYRLLHEKTWKTLPKENDLLTYKTTFNLSEAEVTSADLIEKMPRGFPCHISITDNGKK